MADDFERWGAGSERAREEVLTKHYDELKLLARQQLRRQKRTATLDTTDFQHLVLGKILGSKISAPKDRAQLLALAAIVMRRTLIDLARSKTALKRNAVLINLDEEFGHATPVAHGVLDIHNALIRLKVLNPVQHDIVEMKIFGGLSNDDVALALDMKLHKVKEHWHGAKQWMRVVIENGL